MKDTRFRDAALGQETRDLLNDMNRVFVRSDSRGTEGAVEIENMVALSQAQYDALATKDPKTIYYITE